MFMNIYEYCEYGEYGEVTDVVDNNTYLYLH